MKLTGSFLDLMVGASCLFLVNRHNNVYFDYVCCLCMQISPQTMKSLSTFTKSRGDTIVDNPALFKRGMKSTDTLQHMDSLPAGAGKATPKGGGARRKASNYGIKTSQKTSKNQGNSA